MIFNHASNTQTIVRDIKFWCGIASTDTTTYPLSEMTRNSNHALDTISSLLMANDIYWEWDDQNNADLPIGTTTLVNGQRDYSIATTHLKIHRVRIKDANGNYYTIGAVDRKSISDSLLDQAAGQPECYDKLGNSLLLYPAPATGYVTMASGLEVQFQRGANYFDYTDDTTYDITEPGFDSRYHRLVPLYASLDFCETNGMEKRVSSITNRIILLQNEMKKATRQRNGDEGIKMTMRGINYR